MRSRPPTILVSALALGLLGLGVWWTLDARAGLAHPPKREAFAYIGSTACQSCHPDHHASWSRTYHRTMTQEASNKSVEGAFDGVARTLWGRAVRPVHDAAGYAFEYLDAKGAVTRRVPVARTVGSHRYQQYLTEFDDGSGRYQRLPLIWHNGDRRWIHYNGAFLYDDKQRWDQHATTWNTNCIMCHNTGPQPGIQNQKQLEQRLMAGEQFDFLSKARWDSHVAELGIACESCHGPGAQHASANRNPLRRAWLGFADDADPTIVNPRRLTPDRAADICGACHAQRLPAKLDMIDQWMSTGPTFRPGERLRDHVAPLTIATEAPAGNDPQLFSRRFWSEGTPRLTAYEYQGLTMSACFTQGSGTRKATCIGCHEAHGGEPAGMITAANRQGESCKGCHAAQAADVPAHTHHAATSSGSQCVSCHMAREVYGVMEIHRSHRIVKPDPLASVAANKPEVCTGCHGDRSANWADSALKAWKAKTPFDANRDAALPENLRQLFAGDPVQRAVAAKLAGDENAALTPDARRAQLPILFAAMEDGYPAIRRFAQQSASESAQQLGLSALQGPLSAFDFIGDADARRAQLAAVRAAAPSATPANAPLLTAAGAADIDAIAALRAQADGRAINIGE